MNTELVVAALRAAQVRVNTLLREKRGTMKLIPANNEYLQEMRSIMIDELLKLNLFPEAVYEHLQRVIIEEDRNDLFEELSFIEFCL